MDNHYAVYTGERGDEVIHWFKTEPEAADFVKTLIKEAEAFAYPTWIYDVTILKVQGVVQDSQALGGPAINWRP
jgi:hypothetical protein